MEKEGDMNKHGRELYTPFLILSFFGVLETGTEKETMECEFKKIVTRSVFSQNESQQFARKSIANLNVAEDLCPFLYSKSQIELRICYHQESHNVENILVSILQVHAFYSHIECEREQRFTCYQLKVVDLY